MQPPNWQILNKNLENICDYIATGISKIGYRATGLEAQFNTDQTRII